MWKKIIVLGAGGTGSILLPLATRWLKSIDFKGDFVIVDGDRYDSSNSSRQIFDIGKTGENKAEYQCKKMEQECPGFGPNLAYIDSYLGKPDIEELVEDGTVVINCTDNLAARKIVEDQCLRLRDAAHICCGNGKTTGQVQIMVRRNGQQITPSIYELSPNFNSMTEDRSTMSCEQLALVEGGGQLIMANANAAMLALNMLAQITQEKLYNYGAYIPTHAVFFSVTHNNFVSHETGLTPEFLKEKTVATA